MHTRLFIVLIMIAVIAGGCAPPKIRLYPSAADPLREFTIRGEDKDKLLVIPIRGIISDAPNEQFFRTMPSMVQEIVSQLRLAEEDEKIKAILLKIDSPGGSVIASDILYNEIVELKKRTEIKIVVAMMGVAASGGYYISLPADFIVAHPATITGSVGVIFYRPKVTGLMRKIGVDVDVNKSGAQKDMASPFRNATGEEEKILQSLTDQLGRQFIEKLAYHRRLDKNKLDEVSSARIFLANEALELGLVDKVGYIDSAIDDAKKIANLSQDPRIIVYRRTEYPDDNLYNTSTTRLEGRGISLISLNFPGIMSGMQTGFYYLWAPAISGN
jgi:protease-4